MADARVIAHRKNLPCPRCLGPFFCDDCGICSACHFAPPEVDLPHPPPPAPALACPECGGTASHKRTCSVTLRAAED